MVGKQVSRVVLACGPSSQGPSRRVLGPGPFAQVGGCQSEGKSGIAFNGADDGGSNASRVLRYHLRVCQAAAVDGQKGLGWASVESAKCSAHSTVRHKRRDKGGFGDKRPQNSCRVFRGSHNKQKCRATQGRRRRFTRGCRLHD